MSSLEGRKQTGELALSLQIIQLRLKRYSLFVINLEFNCSHSSILVRNTNYV